MEESFEYSSVASSSNQNIIERRTSTSPRLQQKIDAVQQILTLLESTMTSGKCVQEDGISSISRTIDQLQESINTLKVRKTQMETEFLKFTGVLGGEIMKFCALDNILRTVEQSRTENDVKILLPDVSKVDQFVEVFSNEKMQEWENLKDEIKRLNSESEMENQIINSMTLKVTIKNRILSGIQSDQVNAAAMAINECRGKSMKRMYLRSEIPTYSEKYIEITWDPKNQFVVAGVTNNIAHIVRDVYRNKGEVVNIEMMLPKMQQGPIVNEGFQIIRVQQEQPQRRELMENSDLPNPAIFYCIGEPVVDSNGGIRIINEIRTSLSMVDLVSSSSTESTVFNNNQNISDVNAVANFRKTTDDNCFNVDDVSQSQQPNEANRATFEYSSLNLSQLENGKNIIDESPVEVVRDVELSTTSTGTEECSTSFSNKNGSDSVNPPGQLGSRRTSETKTPITNNEGETLKKAVDPSKAAQRYANAQIRKFLARTINLQKVAHSHGHENISTPEIEEAKVSSSVLMDETDDEIVSSTIPNNTESTLPTINYSMEIDTNSNDQSHIQPNSLENEEDETFDGIKLSKDVVSALNYNGILHLRDFQKELLSAWIDRKDAICRANKKSGKSTVMAMSILQKIDMDNITPQILVATPTIACTQAFVEIVRVLGRNLKLICRNADELTASSSTTCNYMQSKKRSEGHVLVGIPQSILQLLTAQKFQNEAVNALMLDDMDVMLGQGLKSTILQVVYVLNASTQVVATTTISTAAVLDFRKNLRNPVSVVENYIPVVEETVLKDPLREAKLLLQSSSSKTNKSIPPNFLHSSSKITNSSNDSDTQPKIILSPLSSDIEVLECSSINESDDCGSADDELESDKVSCSNMVSDESMMDDDEDYEHYSMTLSRRSSEEIDSMMFASELLEEDDEVMTVIPDYIYRQLGILSRSKVQKAQIDTNCSLDEPKSNHNYVLLEDDDMKIETLSLLDIEDEKAIIFCNTIKKVEWLATVLRQRKLLPQSMHEDMIQTDWNPVLRNFVRGNFCKLLIVTDFLTEVTIQGASLIINYDFPDPPRNYISRAAFAERYVGKTESSTRPIVLSFIKQNNLSDIEDLQITFDIKFSVMANRSHLV